MDYLGDVERRPTALPLEVVELITESQHQQDLHVDKILSVPFASFTFSSSCGLRFACPIFLESVLIRHMYSVAVLVQRIVQQGQGHGPTRQEKPKALRKSSIGGTWHRCKAGHLLKK